ncbi:MAG: VWA domain-containing protein [Acidimicrobiales bacterium]
MVGQRYRYSRWDGSQKGFDFDAFDVLSQLTDDLMYHGDPMAALRRLMQEGFEDRNGERVQGLREMLERLRRERQERLENHDLGGVYDEVNNELLELVDQERQALEDRGALADMELADPGASDEAARNAELAKETTASKQMQLDLLPDDLAGRVRGLQNYEFESNEAQQRFDDLLDKLRQQLMQQQFDQMSGAMQNMSPEDMARMKDMMAELNNMLEQRARGEEPDFEGFMDRYGDFFPENPETLDELLENMAQRMAAMQAMLNSMTPEQRAQLMDLSNQLLEDMDLNFEVNRLGQNLQQMFPDAGWQQSYDFSGFDPLGFADASQMLQDLGQLDQLEQFLRQSTAPQSLAEVDLEQVRRLLGDESAASLDRISELAKMMEEQGLIQTKEGRLELTPRGLRRLGQQALGDLFSKLSPDRVGKHDTQQSGIGHERNFETKPYEFGDPFNLQIERTVRNAIQRAGGGTPVRLTPDDFEVERTERQVRSSTVLMLDLSLSMPMRDNFLPAKKVAMALHSLISSQYPRDYLGIVSFSEVAKELKASDLPEVSWDFVYGTNMQHAFRLSRNLLARQTGTKQIIMITDGEPTAHLLNDGTPFFSYPPARETVEQTMAEVMRCTRAGITINTFMLDPDSGLRGFIERLTALNKGRAFFTSPENLGDYVLVDFIEHKRKLLTGRRRSA